MQRSWRRMLFFRIDLHVSKCRANTARSETYSCNDCGIAGETAALLSCTTQTLGMRATGWVCDSREANGEAIGESSNSTRFGSAKSIVDEKASRLRSPTSRQNG